MNGDQAPQFTDAVGKTVPRPFVPPQVASPINLLNPDRYEFYTFNDVGELVKRLMTLKEIQSIVANGNGAMIGDNEPESQSVILNTIPLSNKNTETKVQDIVDNVQNVLSREMENNKNASHIPSQMLDTPDVSSSWSMILPAIFGNTGDEILPHRPINMTPETEIVDTTTSKVSRRTTTTTKAPTSRTPVKTTPSTTTTPVKTDPSTTKPAKLIPTTRAPQQMAQTSAAPTSKTQLFNRPSTTVESTKKPFLKIKPKPTIDFRSTTSSPTEAAPETTTPEEAIRKTSRPSTQKLTTTKKSIKKPTSFYYKRPLTNSPIIIEKIPKKQVVVESKTTGGETDSKIEHATQKSSTTLEMTANPSLKSPISVEQSTSFNTKTITVTRTDAPSTTSRHQTSTEKAKSPSTTEETVPTEATSMMMTVEQTTRSTSEEDRQDDAINQIIGSLQSNLFKAYEMITTTDQSTDKKVPDYAMEKLGDLNLVPDKFLLNDHLFIDETEPIIKDLPTTTSAPEDATTFDGAVHEKFEATTVKAKNDKFSLQNNEVMQKIETLIKEQGNEKLKNKPDVLGFDDDDETEIKLKDTLNSKKHMTQSEYITKAATIASILSTKLADSPTTTPAPSEESDTNDVSTILSEALSNVIQLMLKNQDDKNTSPRPSEEPSGFDLSQLLHHYEDLNSKQDQLEALSLLSETFLTTEQAEGEVVTIQPVEGNVSFETTVVMETSSVSMKKGEHFKARSTTLEPEIPETTTDGSDQEFSTFFFIDDDQDDSTVDAVNDELGDFTTEKFLETEKRFSNRKEEFYTTLSPVVESEEDSGEFVSHAILNAIGIASDEEDETITDKLKAPVDSQDSDEVENAFSSLSSTLDKTLTADVKTDLTLTSQIASSLISVADSISDTLNEGEDESEEFVTSNPTTVMPIMNQDPSTVIPIIKPISKTEKVATTEKVLTTTENRLTTTEINMIMSSEASETVKADVNDAIIEYEITKKAVEAEEASSTTEQVIIESKPVNGSGVMLHLSIIRKDNSLEEIDFFTPPTPTIRTSFTDDNFIKIENIETTLNPKLSLVKNKVQGVHEGIKPIYIAFRSTTAKSSVLPEVASSQSTFSVEHVSKINVQVPTERVPLIEVTKSSEIPIQFTSTEDNLVEIKVQTKPTIVVPSSTEDHLPTISQFKPSTQIKNNIKNAQLQMRPQSPPIDLSAAPKEALGLAASTASLSTDLSEFSKLCNELAFSFWKSVTADGISQSRSVIISPFALTSALSMLFLGARGQTSGEMNDLLRLDDMVSFNPHVVFRNISDSIEQSRRSGIAAAAFVRELYSDRSKGKLLPYFKEKAQQFYGAHVEEVNFNVINDILRRRTNLLVKRHTFGKINEYLKTNNIWVNEPLAVVSANVFLVS